MSVTVFLKKRMRQSKFYFGKTLFAMLNYFNG